MKPESGRLPTLDEMNRSFTAAVAGIGGIGGSVISFLVSGAFLWALVRLVRGDFTLTTDPRIRAIAAVLAAYTAGEVILAFVHFEEGANLRHIVQKLPFLAVLPIYSRLALSERADILRALQNGAAVGAVLALVAAAAEALSGASRVAGGAGNPGPFALVTLVMYAICLQAMTQAHDDKLRKFAMLAAATCAAACVILSGIRSMWPALLISPLVFLFANRMASRRPFTVTKTAGLFAGAIAVAVAIGAGFVASRVTALESDFTKTLTEHQYDNSVGRRLVTWQYGVKTFEGAPFFGVGTEDALSGLTAFAKQNYGFSLVQSHFHNAAIDAVVRGGLFSFVLLAGVIIVGPLLAHRQRRDPMGDAGYALMLAITGTYLCAGSVGLMLGHDIHDHLFVYMLVTTAFLVFGESEKHHRANHAGRAAT